MRRGPAIRRALCARESAFELIEARHYLETVNATAVPCNTTALGKAIAALAGGDAAASLRNTGGRAGWPVS